MGNPRKRRQIRAAKLKKLQELQTPVVEQKPEPQPEPVPIAKKKPKVEASVEEPKPMARTRKKTVSKSVRSQKRKPAVKTSVGDAK